MFGGFILLLCEIRFEHRAVILDDLRPWIPIVYSGLMLLLIPLANANGERGGKTVLRAAYLLASCLGVLGMMFHAEGHLLQRFLEVMTVCCSTPQTGAAIKALHPPLLAPAAFVGLGAIGFLFSVDEKPENCERLKEGSNRFNETFS